MIEARRRDGTATEDESVRQDAKHCRRDADAPLGGRSVAGRPAHGVEQDAPATIEEVTDDTETAMDCLGNVLSAGWGRGAQEPDGFHDSV